MILQQDFDKIYRLVKNYHASKMPLSAITYQTRYLSAKDRNKILELLVKDKKITKLTEGKSTYYKYGYHEIMPEIADEILQERQKENKDGLTVSTIVRIAISRLMPGHAVNISDKLKEHGRSISISNAKKIIKEFPQDYIIGKAMASDGVIIFRCGFDKRTVSDTKKGERKKIFFELSRAAYNNLKKNMEDETKGEYTITHVDKQDKNFIWIFRKKA